MHVQCWDRKSQAHIDVGSHFVAKGLAVCRCQVILKECFLQRK